MRMSGGMPSDLSFECREHGGRNRVAPFLHEMGGRLTSMTYFVDILFRSSAAFCKCTIAAVAFSRCAENRQ
jgi:hypothetical protein